MKLVLDGRVAIPRMTGAGRYIAELAQRLPSLDASLHVEVLLLPAMRATSIPDLLTKAGVKVHYVNVRIATVRQWVLIPLVLERLRPDLYHYPFLDLPYVTFPSVVTIYDLNPILHPNYFEHFATLKRPVARRLIRSTLRRCRAAMAISEATRGRIRENYPELAQKVRTVHLGIDLTAWTGNVTSDSGHPSDASDGQTLWRSRPYVLYVGVDRPHKNLVRLVGAFSRFRVTNEWQPGTGPYLRLAGVGEGSKELRAQVTQLSLGKDVRLDHELDESSLRAAYLGAQAMVYVSTSEGFGLPLLEAFACGVPVVTATASSLPEVAGDAAVYANPQDEHAIAETLGRVWQDRDLRRTLADRGRERVKEFSWDVTARETLQTYYDVLR